MFSFDTVIENISGNGRYQILLIGIVCAASIPSAFVMTLPVFLAAIPDSRCRVEPYDNHTLYPNISNDLMKDVFIPWNPVSKSNDRCLMRVYDTTDFDINSIQTQELVNKTQFKDISCPDGYVFDDNIFQSTIVTEWDLVCDKFILSALSTSLYYVGIFFGSVIGGVLSDKYGRVFIYRLSCFLSLAIGCAVSLSQNIYVFTFLRLILALVFFPSVVSGFSYLAEVTKIKWRTMIAVIYSAIIGIGCAILSLIAYKWRNWRDLQIAATVIGFGPIFLLSWLLPKSPRWLCVNGRLEEAKVSCEQMAKHNNSRLSSDVWKEVEEHYSLVNDRNNEAVEKMSDRVKRPKQGKNNLLSFLEKPYTRYMIFSNMFVWMVTCMVYYGLILNSGSLAGDVFLNNAAGGIMEVVADIFAVPCIVYFGCTKTTTSALFLASCSCLTSTVVNQLSGGASGWQTFATVLAMIGRFGASLSFCSIYLHTVELFPTVGRTTALGLSSMAARIGSIFSPFAVPLQLTVPWLTPVIFGLSALVAAVIASTFPDTRNKELTATFAEAESAFYEHLKTSFASKIFCMTKAGFMDEEQKTQFITGN